GRSLARQSRRSVACGPRLLSCRSTASDCGLLPAENQLDDAGSWSSLSSKAKSMNVSLAYGRGSLQVELPDDRTTVIEPLHQPGLPDERQSVVAALAAPIGSPALRSQLTAETRVVIVHTDITRPTPNDRLIPWLLEYLMEAGARRENITLLNGLGTHRPNARAELEQMLTPQVVANYRCVNHEPENEEALAPFGTTRTG